MSEQPNIKIPAPPGWTEAMQGTAGNAKRAATSKRIALLLSFGFFGIFLWFYVIYNLGHPSKKATAEPAAQPIMAGQPISGAPMQFGMPRGGFQAQPMMAPGPIMASGQPMMPAQPMMAPVQPMNPYQMGGMPGSAAAAAAMPAKRQRLYVSR